MKLALNGINLGALMSAVEQPRETVRAIGGTSEAADGSTSTTRTARKKDMLFTTVLLSLADAHAWASLLAGEGEVWSFDSNLYGSKGTGPSSSTNTTQSAGGAKYGAGKLSVGATTGSITWNGVAVNEFGDSSKWTVMVWRYSGTTWQHFVVRSDGELFQDGVAVGGGVSWLGVSGGNVNIANSSGVAILYDDLVVLPFEVPDDWPAQVYAAGVAYGPAPYLNATGDFVTEQSTRVVLGRAEEASFMLTAAGPKKSLSVELIAR